MAAERKARHVFDVAAMREAFRGAQFIRAEALRRAAEVALGQLQLRTAADDLERVAQPTGLLKSGDGWGVICTALRDIAKQSGGDAEKIRQILTGHAAQVHEPDAAPDMRGLGPDLSGRLRENPKLPPQRSFGQPGHATLDDAGRFVCLDCRQLVSANACGEGHKLLQEMLPPSEPAVQGVGRVRPGDRTAHGAPVPKLRDTAAPELGAKATVGVVRFDVNPNGVCGECNRPVPDEACGDGHRFLQQIFRHRRPADTLLHSSFNGETVKVRQISAEPLLAEFEYPPGVVIGNTSRVRSPKPGRVDFTVGADVAAAESYAESPRPDIDLSERVMARGNASLRHGAFGLRSDVRTTLENMERGLLDDGMEHLLRWLAVYRCLACAELLLGDIEADGRPRMGLSMGVSACRTACGETLTTSGRVRELSASIGAHPRIQQATEAGAVKR